MSEVQEPFFASKEELESLVYPWRKEWVGMPDFVQEDLAPMHSVLIHFLSSTGMEEFSTKLGIKITARTQSAWYPLIDRDIVHNICWMDE